MKGWTMGGLGSKKVVFNAIEFFHQNAEHEKLFFMEYAMPSNGLHFKFASRSKDN